MVLVSGLVNPSTYPNAPFHLLFRHSSYWSFASLRWRALSSQPSTFCLHGAQPTTQFGCGASTNQVSFRVLNLWQLNLLFFQDLAENEIRFRTTPKRPEENSESEFIELKLKNSNSIVNFMLTMITMVYCEQYPKVPPNGWSEDSWRKDTTERLHWDSQWHLEGWQLNLLFSQDLAENEIRFRTTRKRPEENSESEFIELKLKNSNSIVNFMLTMITMVYCEQYPKVPPNGWSEDSWRKDTTERLHRDSLWHLEGWQLNLLFFQDLAENEIRFRTTRKRPEENSESEFIELKLKNSNSIVNFMLTMITMVYCEQYPKVPPNGWSEDSWRKDTTERLHWDSQWHLEGWQLNLLFSQDLAENEIRFRTTPKRPEENSESEFIELKLKNSNSIVNFMLTMITMVYCEQYPKVPPNGWSEDSWRKDTTERLHWDSQWHLEGWQLNLLFSQDLAENEIRFRTTRKRPEENSESEFIELKLRNSNSIVNFMLTMITMVYCEQYPKVPPNGWSEDSWRKDTTKRLHRDSLWHLEGWQLNLLFFQDLAENEIRFRTTRKRPEENSESEFIELKLKNSNSIVNFMLTMITMVYCEQYPKVPPNE